MANRVLTGIAAAPGIAIGRLSLLSEELNQDFSQHSPAGTPAGEQARFTAAQHIARQELAILQEHTRQTAGEHAAAVFDAHQLMLEDMALTDGITEEIAAGRSAEGAVQLTIATIAAMFLSMDDDYMQERAADIKDIGKRLLRILQGRPQTAGYEGILAARDLLPSDTAAIDFGKVFGFITALGGKTSHSSILARAMGLAAVVGLGSQLDSLQAGDTVIVDGHTGQVLVNPTDGVLTEYSLRRTAEQQAAAQLAKQASLPGVTLDGKPIEIAGNIGTPEEMPAMLAAGAEGIGLFRTEFLFLDKTSVPTEEEQYQAYSTVLQAMPQQKVIIRTLDAGGDKQLPFIQSRPEENPALGLRATRLCMVHRDIFHTQLRALLRAAVHGNLYVMFPMIATLEELQAAKAAMAAAAADLAAQNIPHVAAVPIGIMIEVPAAALMADVLAGEADFFSIGTNDLVQYTLAADRMNEHLAALSDYCQPAVIRLISRVADAARQHGIWVGMCGEMAGDPLATPLLVGLGLTELSMNQKAVPAVKHLLRRLNSVQAAQWADQILQLSTAAAVRRKLEELQSQIAP